MYRSLRARLLFWYASIATFLIVAFSGTVSYLYWRSLLGRIDRDLSAHAAEIASALRRGPSGFFDLELPTQYREAEFVNRAPRTYYIVWDSDSGKSIQYYWNTAKTRWDSFEINLPAAPLNK